VEKINYQAMYMNAITSGVSEGARVPMTFDTDREAIQVVLSMIGLTPTIHERYAAGAVTELDGPRARDFTTAANAAWRFVRKPTLRLAFKDLGFSLLDRGDDAFLYAYRAVENARRFHADKVSATETKPVWPPLHAALGVSVQAPGKVRRARGLGRRGCWR